MFAGNGQNFTKRTEFPCHSMNRWSLMTRKSETAHSNQQLLLTDTVLGTATLGADLASGVVF